MYMNVDIHTSLKVEVYWKKLGCIGNNTCILCRDLVQ